MRRGDSFIANAIALHCVGQSDGAVWCSTNKNERLGDHLVAFTWDGRIGLPQNSGNGPQPFRCTTVNLRLKKKKFKVLFVIRVDITCGRSGGSQRKCPAKVALGTPGQSDQDELKKRRMSEVSNLGVEPARQNVDQHGLVPLQVGEPVLVSEHHGVAELGHQVPSPGNNFEVRTTFPPVRLHVTAQHPAPPHLLQVKEDNTWL